MVAAGAEADRTTATGATMAMLADMVIDRLGGSLEGHADNPWWAVHSPLMEFAELQLEARGQLTARKRPYGFVRLACAVFIGFDRRRRSQSAIA